MQSETAAHHVSVHMPPHSDGRLLAAIGTAALICSPQLLTGVMPELLCSVTLHPQTKILHLSAAITFAKQMTFTASPCILSR